MRTRHPFKHSGAPTPQLVACLASLVLLLATVTSAQSAPQPNGSTPSASAPGAAQGPLKIGFITSLTGVGADPSKDMVNGIDLFLDQRHHKIAGRDVQLIVRNDESNPATAMGEVRKLVENDKVDVLDGLLLANIGYAVAPLAEKFETPMVYAVSAGDDLTQRKRAHWIVRTSYTSSQASHPFGEWVFKTLHYKKIVTIGMDYPFGYEVVGGFQQSYEQAGGKVVQKIWAPLGFRDFSQYLSKIHPGDADAVFVLTTSAAAELFPKQYEASGLKLPIVAGGTSYDECILPHLGDDALGAISCSQYSAALDTPANKQFVKDYRQKFHTDPSSYAENAYLSGMWIEKAVESLKGDTSNKQKLLTALRQVELKDSPQGPIKLDAYYNPIENIYVRKVTKVNGHLENTVIDTFKNVSQFWKWPPAEYLKQPAYSRDFPPCKNCTDSH